MNTSSNATSVPCPPVVWAQRADKVILTVKLEGCNEKDTTIEIKEQSVYFKGKGGTNKTDHEVLMELNKEIDTEKSIFNNTGREIVFFLIKKESSQGYWPRLLKDSKKVHYLKTDFDKWRDEDESDDEEGGAGGGPGGDFNLDQMMAQMGGMQGGMGGMPGMGGMGGMPGMGGMMGGDEEDSDDEDLPDLQQ